MPSTSMFAKTQHYLESRLRDPVTWLAISFIGAWAVSARYGLPPFQTLSLICLAFSAAEWWLLVSWWRKRSRFEEEFETLAPAADRWKALIILMIGAATLAIDLWLVSSDASILGVAFTVLSISSLITLGYAWSRPITATPAGLLIGTGVVRWSDVRRITWNDRGSTRIDFENPNYFYGTKLRVMITPEQALRLDGLLPVAVERSGTPFDIRLSHGLADGTSVMFKLAIVVGSCLSALPTLHVSELNAQQPSQAASFVSDSIRSTSLNTVVRLKIGLPLEFDAAEPADDRYPVLIMLGARDDLAFAATLTSLRLLNAPFGNAVPPLIVVGVASDPASPYAKSMIRIDSLRSNPGGANSYAEFLAKELLPYIRSRYPTLSYAVIAGHSRYGVLSLYALAMHGDVFNAAVAVSPAFWELSDEVNDRILMDTLVERIRPGRSRIYIGVGEYDSLPIRRAGVDLARRLRKRSAPERFRYEELLGDTHQTARQGGFVQGIRWVFEPISLAANPVYALMGGYARDLDTVALRKAYGSIKVRYAANAKALGFSEKLPSRFLGAIVSLPPIENPSKPIPIYQLICADFAAWYPTKELPRACRAPGK